MKKIYETKKKQIRFKAKRKITKQKIVQKKNLNPLKLFTDNSTTLLYFRQEKINGTLHIDTIIKCTT